MAGLANQRCVGELLERLVVSHQGVTSELKLEMKFPALSSVSLGKAGPSKWSALG